MTPDPDRADGRAEGHGGGLQVLEPGPLALVQDLGRPGYFASGVGVSGAADTDALRLANRLVGNEESAAAVEVLLGGLRLRARGRLVLAVTGAPAALTLDGRPAAHGLAVRVENGVEVALAAPEAGMRSYLAVRGGIDVEPVLASRSRDTLAGLGPDPLAAGDVLPVGTPGDRPWAGAPAPGAAGSVRPPGDVVRVRVVLGPRQDWFADPGHLLAGTWTASSQADRVGVRLDRSDGGADDAAPSPSPSLGRSAAARDAELPTEGVATGAVQVPPSGQPVVFLADHPITGGYPVVACVVAADLPLVAQLRPGQAVAFDLADAPTDASSDASSGTWVDLPGASATAVRGLRRSGRAPRPRHRTERLLS